MKRRGFVIASTATVLSATLGLWSRSQRGSASAAQPTDSSLVKDPDGLLDLREGFRYRVIQRTGEPMNDGYRVPGRPDAMGCFPLGKGRWALMRNHELDDGLVRLAPQRPGTKPPAEAYDPRVNGGVSRLVLDRRGRVRSSNLVLAGTSRNCAGGMSPWGWLSCEESVHPQHGYVFLCSIHAERVQPPQKIPAYGRFLHEAVAIDPANHAAYLTEDRGDGCLYRFVPNDRDAPFGKGRLQALAIAGAPRYRLCEERMENARFAVSWVDVPESAGLRDNLRHVAHERGAAFITRGEGIWRLDDGFAFTSTTGGPQASGQVFHLAPTAEGGVLRMLAQSKDPSVLDMPDNITLTPWGDLLVCEDNHRSPCLRLIRRETGAVQTFAFNRGSASEFAGVCFSPDGRILFVNIQEDGLTVAIEGPWKQLAAG